MRPHELAAVIVSLLALFGAIGTGYMSIAAKTDASEVEHIIELKSADKFAEILRRLESIDHRLDKIEHIP
jgi:hypothetical protein